METNSKYNKRSRSKEAYESACDETEISMIIARDWANHGKTAWADAHYRMAEVKLEIFSYRNPEYQDKVKALLRDIKSERKNLSFPVSSAEVLSVTDSGSKLEVEASKIV